MARILIAEDDPLVSSFMEKRLRTAGYGTEVADDGDKATELALSGDFDLVLLDMALPSREGHEVLRELRSRGSQIPVIVVTGRPEMRDLVTSLNVGAADFVVKPFRFEELLARVRANLEFPAAGAEPEAEVAANDDVEAATSEDHEDRPRPAVVPTVARRTT